MLNPTPSADLQSVRTIRIPGTEIIPRAQPSIAVGEVLRFSVRSNNEQGQGQLYFRGMLIPAALPPGLEFGDKIYAKVTEASNQLVLKILETQKSQVADEITKLKNIAGTGTTQEQLLATQLLQFLDETGHAELISGSPLALPLGSQSLAPKLEAGKGAKTSEQVASKTLLDIEQQIQKLADNIGTDQTLTNPLNAQSQLLANAKGQTTIILRETAHRLKSLLSNEPGLQSTDRLLLVLKDELANLLDRSASDNLAVSKHLDFMLNTLRNEMNSSKHGSDKDKLALQAAFQDLQQAKETPESAKQGLETLLHRLEYALGSEKSKSLSLDAKTSGELQQIAVRLEQLATTQEQLNQLNPLMQALGEPALILFPFLSQGLLNHSEVSVESQLRDQNHGGGRGREYDTGDHSPDTTPYQRVQVSVPLPSLGNIDVDVAHRNNEILVRFSLSDPQAEAFLKEQFGDLLSALQTLNFTSTDLMTHLGQKEPEAKIWSLAAKTGRQFIA